MLKIDAHPVNGPYTPEIHAQAWAAWDKYREANNLQNLFSLRKIFMDNYIKNLPAPQTKA